jgi:2-dehydrotetronate isomerase
MPRFAANLTMLYNEYEFTDRFAAAARDGFQAVEYLFPYEYSAELLASLLKEFDLQQVLINAPPGDWTVGERGLACLPGREGEFRAAVRLALQYARALHCPRIHVMAGIAPLNVEQSLLVATYTANLMWAANKRQKKVWTFSLSPLIPWACQAIS